MANKRLKIPQVIITATNASGKYIRTRKYGPFVFKRCMDAYDKTACRWVLFDKSNKEWGSIYIAPRRNDTMCVCNTNLDHELHGLGIGKIMYKHLVDFYGALESDPGGCTSKQAARVWKSLGAKTMIGLSSWGSRETRFRVESTINPPKKKESLWTIYTSNMMNWLKLVSLIPKKSLSRIGSKIKYRRPPTKRWIV